MNQARFRTFPLTARIVRTLLLAILAFAASGQVAAQTEPCLDRTIPVNVYSEKGQAILGLTAPNFRASLQGRPIHVTAAAYDRGPRRIVILLDVSGSMHEFGWLPFGLNVAEDLASLAPPQASVALLTFDARTEDRMGFSSPSTRLVDEIQTLQRTAWSDQGSSHKTALWDAIAEGLSSLEPARVGDAIYVISDGGENASQTDQAQIEAAVASAGVRLYGLIPVDIEGSRNRTVEEANGPSVLWNLAVRSGGTLVKYVPAAGRPSSFSSVRPLEYRMADTDRQNLTLAAKGFYDQITSFYRLDLRLPDPVDKPRKLRLDVVDASGRREKNLQVIYPQQLAPCQSH